MEFLPRTGAAPPEEDLLSQAEPPAGFGRIPRNRRQFLGGAMAALAASSVRLRASSGDEQGAVGDPFIVLLRGLYHPAPALPDLGLQGVDLTDTTYIKTHIYPVFALPQVANQSGAIGVFYVSFSNPVCVYDLPGGAIAMQFASGPVVKNIGFNTFVPYPDGKVGFYLEGTFELTVIDATGIYKRFKGGHNHMVDRLHQLDAAGTIFNEFCFCNISTYQFP
jgi:hypothetical protein